MIETGQRYTSFLNGIAPAQERTLLVICVEIPLVLVYDDVLCNTRRMAIEDLENFYIQVKQK